MIRLLPLFAALLAVGLVGACTGPVQEEPPPPPPSRLSPSVRPLVDGRCQLDGAGLVPPLEQVETYNGSLPPDGFEPARLVRCVVADDTKQSSDGAMVYTVTQEAGSVTPALIEALKLPDTPRADPKAACPLRATKLLYLILVNSDGRGYVPRIPIDWCLEPRPEVAKAVSDIAWQKTDTYDVTRP